MLQNLRVRQKIGLLMVIFLLGFSIFGLFASYGFSKVKVNGPIYKNIVQGKDLIADILPPPEYIIESYLIVLQMVDEQDPAKINDFITRSVKLREEYDTRHEFWMKDLQPGDMKEAMTVGSYDPAIEFFQIRDESFFPAILSEDRKAASVLALGALKVKYEEHRAMVDKVVVMATERNAAEEAKAADTVVVIIGILFALGIVVVASTSVVWVMTNRSFQPLEQVTQMLKDISEGEGDLTKRIDVKTNDEIGDLAKYFNVFVMRIQEVMINIGEVTRILLVTSKDLLLTSNNIHENNEQTNNKTSSVNASVEEITANMDNVSAVIGDSSKSIQSIAATVEQISTNIRNIASASEQTSASVVKTSELVAHMSGSIESVSSSSKDVSASVNQVALAVKEINISLNEVSRNCERSIQITADASEKAKRTNAIIDELNQSSKLIGKIVNMIDNIANQTNMLALNAAIEAAGAGEAGKGFAVVANEVKELAKQTTKATDEISNQIEAMKTNIDGAVKAVSTINDVIEETQIITNTIAAAVSEQSATTGQILHNVVQSSNQVNRIAQKIIEIADNSQYSATCMSEASKGVSDIAKSVVELSSSSIGAATSVERVSAKVKEIADTSESIAIAVNDISKDVQDVSISVASSVTSADKTNDFARRLEGIAVNMDKLVNRFKV